MLALRYATLAVAVAGGLACGLRTDPGSGVGVCVSQNDGDTDGQPRAGSCTNPIEVTYVSGEIISGNLGGCSEGSSWCGGSGGEDYYLYRPHRGDVRVTFLPVDEDPVEPVLRVIKVPQGASPCGSIADVDTQVCAPITETEDARNWYAGGVEFEHYIVVDSQSGSSGNYKMRLDYGLGPVSEDCNEQIANEEEVIRLGRGGVYTWEASLPSGQGWIDSKCGGPGTEDKFIVRMIEGGTLNVTVEPLDGDWTPIVNITRGPGCAGESGIRCMQAEGPGGFANVSFSSSGETTRFIVVDQAGVSGGRYLMTAWMD